MHQHNQELQIGLIGFGYWGPNLARNFEAAEGCVLAGIADISHERLAKIRSLFPNVRLSSTAEELLEDRSIDAVAIATPVHAHYKIAKAALLRGKHVLVEKPVAASFPEAEDLVNLAMKKGLVIMADHTFLYSEAVRKINEMIRQGEIGNLTYFDSTRINLGIFQPDVNVLWDLAPHDLSILNLFQREKPLSVNAVGACHTGNGIEHIAYLSIRYSSGFIAHLNCSWTSPVKIRMILVGGDRRMIVYNDLEPTEKIRVYETGYRHNTLEEQYQIRVDYRTGNVFIPKIEIREPLKEVVGEFIRCIQHGTKPVADIDSALNVIRILEASALSLKRNGCEVPIIGWT